MSERVHNQKFNWRIPAGATLAGLMLAVDSYVPDNTPEYRKTTELKPEVTTSEALTIPPQEQPSASGSSAPEILIDLAEPTTDSSADTPTQQPEVEPMPTADYPEPSTPVYPDNAPETTPSQHLHAVDCMVEKCIALTFDDGPGPYTGALLDYLDEHDAKATFFLVGNRVNQYQDVAIAERDRGHQIGNHSWDHDNLTTKSSQSALEDINRTSGEIEAATGVRPAVMRPPYGATNQRIVEALGQPQILWSVDTEDWKYRDSDYVADYVIEHAERGDIILMHDIHKTSVEAVPEILEELTSQGYVFVTVDDLLGDDLAVGRYNQQDF